MKFRGSQAHPNRRQKPIVCPTRLPEVGRHGLILRAEFKLLHRGRFTVNLRALAGIMRQSNLFLPYLGLQFAYGGANLFAASLGGSVDYRISDRFSYRVIQPELLTTVSNAGGTLRAYPNAQVSTGLVFSFGKL